MARLKIHNLLESKNLMMLLGLLETRHLGLSIYVKLSKMDPIYLANNKLEARWSVLPRRMKQNKIGWLGDKIARLPI